MDDILKAHVEYCWIDMPSGSRETGVPTPVPRVARLDSLVGQLVAAGPGPCQSCDDTFEFPAEPDDDDEAFILELRDDDSE